MNGVLIKFKRLLQKARDLFPSALPVGVTEFNSWIESLEQTWDLPTKDPDSVRFVISSLVVNLGPTIAYKPKFYFVLALRAGAAKQVASSFFYQIKEKQRAAVAAATAASETK